MITMINMINTLTMNIYCFEKTLQKCRHLNEFFIQFRSWHREHYRWHLFKKFNEKFRPDIRKFRIIRLNFCAPTALFIYLFIFLKIINVIDFWEGLWGKHWKMKVMEFAQKSNIHISDCLCVHAYFRLTEIRSFICYSHSCDQSLIN